MEDAEEVADDGARGVGVRVECGEGDGRDNGKEDLSAEPDDECEIEKSAKKSLHGDRIQGKGGELAGSILNSLGFPALTNKEGIEQGVWLVFFDYESLSVMGGFRSEFAGESPASSVCSMDSATFSGIWDPPAMVSHFGVADTQQVMIGLR